MMCRKINKINVRKDSEKNIHTTVSVGLTTVSVSVCDVDSDVGGDLLVVMSMVMSVSRAWSSSLTMSW